MQQGEVSANNLTLDSEDGKLIVSQILAASFIGHFDAAATHFDGRSCFKPGIEVDEDIIPRLNRKECGRVGDLERFSHYVARQMGFADANDCPQLCKLADDYLRKSEGCEENIYGYFEKESDAKSLYEKLIEEFDRCILGYFAFHWDQAPQMISRALSDESDQNMRRLKDFVMAATRKQRFDKVTKDLKVTRVLSNLVEEIKVIRGDGEPKCTDVMAPVALSERSPVLLLMGGGMGAGKSTVLNEIMKESFWSGTDAVRVEADAFKERDVLYRTLSSMGHHNDMLQTAELVHQSSTDAASSVLVTALNEGRDVVMDGTLSWEPFVDQTIAMARNVHKQRYRMGVGYKKNEDGTITENYWEQVKEDEDENGEIALRRPYRIELVGVVCDAYLAVVRGIRRAIMVGRAVRVNSQLTSHKRFASAFPRYCKLVDNARLYCTNALGSPPRLIAWKDGYSNLLVDPDEIKSLTIVSSLNDKAQSVFELYTDPNVIFEPDSVFKDIVLSPARAGIQLELKNSIQKIQNY